MDEILDLIWSVSKGIPTYSLIVLVPGDCLSFYFSVSFSDGLYASTLSHLLLVHVSISK